MFLPFLSCISQVDKGVVPLAGTSGESTTQGATNHSWSLTVDEYNSHPGHTVHNNLAAAVLFFL